MLDLADAGIRSVRIYIPAAALDRIPTGAEVAFMLPGSFSILRMKLAAPGGEAFALPEGFVSSKKYKGMQTPLFYSSRMPLLASAGNPSLGIGGAAKILGRRHSVAARAIRLIADLAGAHFW